MIDLSAPPYCVRGDWFGNDACATDWWTAIQDAANCAGENPGGISPDYGGCEGDTLILPKGSIMIGHPLVLPPGVSLQGSGNFATTLVVKESFDPSRHFIDLGDGTRHYAAFGNQIKNMILWNNPNVDAAQGAAMVYTNNTQDTDPILDNVRVMGYKRRCIWAEIGFGGASIAKFRQVTTACTKPNLPGVLLDYGEGTLIHFDGFEPCAGRQSNDPASPLYNLPIPGTIGMVMKGGILRMERMHPEIVDTCLLVNHKTARCFTDVDWSTIGGGVNAGIVFMGNPLQKGRLRVANTQCNASNPSCPTVLNGQSGAVSIFGDIVDPIRL
ncbi:hypothetical protein [Bradyrhizobium lablabi]|uniref:hypothetical protein n=1 Tax=Bradyrhizobium lablabi TaxID=722472 RepID=UPI001BAA0152|nr:hypothetical protein [Bradyrhizobium lablabi]MBR0693693.1 hypothetical protein [Bradyrhizobium lablabi]